MGNTMAVPRRRRKPGLVSARTWLLAAAALAGGLGLPVGAAASEMVVMDRRTGVAINGYDPVAYFTDGAPVLGQGDFEYTFGGAVLRVPEPGHHGAFMTEAH